MACHLTKRWGSSVPNPSASDLQSALDELGVEDGEHPDCWLEDECGWALSAFGSGLLILENVETNEGPWHMRGVSREKVLELWRLLKAGKLAEIREHAWLPGFTIQTRKLVACAVPEPTFPVSALPGAGNKFRTIS
jgi:hypothetical protein